jgi:hypothetical protein
MSTKVILRDEANAQTEIAVDDGMWDDIWSTLFAFTPPNIARDPAQWHGKVSQSTVARLAATAKNEVVRSGRNGFGQMASTLQTFLSGLKGLALVLRKDEIGNLTAWKPQPLRLSTVNRRVTAGVTAEEVKADLDHYFFPEEQP